MVLVRLHPQGFARAQHLATVMVVMAVVAVVAVQRMREQVEREMAVARHKPQHTDQVPTRSYLVRVAVVGTGPGQLRVVLVGVLYTFELPGLSRLTGLLERTAQTEHTEDCGTVEVADPEGLSICMQEPWLVPELLVQTVAPEHRLVVAAVAGDASLFCTQL